MKTTYIVITIFITLMIFSSSNHNAYAPLLGESTEQLYDESKIIVIGNIVSTHEIQDGKRTEYVIQPQEYLKPVTFEDITKPLIAQGIGSVSNFVLYFHVYNVGDRALFFLQQEDDHYFISPYSIPTESNCNGKQLLALNYSPGDFAVTQENNTYEKMFTDEPINITGYVHNHFDLKSRHMELDFTVHTPRSSVILTEKRQVSLQECTGYTQSTWSFVPTIPGKYSVGVDIHDENGNESGGGSFCCITVINRNGSSDQSYDIPKTLPTQTALVEISKGSSSAGCQASNSCFVPYQVAVKPGGLVVWHNNDTVGHTVTSGKPTDDSTGIMFDSSIILPGNSFNYTFSDSGNFSYFDQVHPWMTGNVIVGNGTASPSVRVPHFEKRTVPTPLEQFKSGIDPYKTQCESDRLLVIAAEDNSPACVFDTSLNMLWEGGWISKSPAIYAKYLDPVTEEEFQSKIISKDDAVGIVQNYIRGNNITLSTGTNSSFKITTSLSYELISQGYNYLLEVDQKTGLPTTTMSPWWKVYYQNPQWWAELEKYYLGMENKRIEDGELVWHVDYHDCECISPYPMFMVDAITGKVILAWDGQHRY